MTSATAQRGRPRSETSRQAILAATRDLLLEGDYDSLTTAEIAKQAGVGRQTVYRWWNSKAAVVADCVIEGLVMLPLETPAATGNLPPTFVSGSSCRTSASHRRRRHRSCAP